MSIAEIFVAVSLQFHLPAGLLSSLCWVESRHNINAVHVDDNGSDSLGICQIKLDTAKDIGFKGTAKQLMSPETNIYYAAKYLARQRTRYHSIKKAVIAYNQGHAGQLTTTKYQRKVFARWKNY